MQKIIVSYGDEVLASGVLGKSVVFVEGNYYFEKEVVNFEFLQIHGAGQNYTCPIKRGTCDYYDLVMDSRVIMTEVGWVYESVANKMFEILEHKISFYNQGKGLDFKVLEK